MSNWAKVLTTSALGLLMLAGGASATPWIETGNTQARHHLEALSAMGCFDNGLTLTWPVNWSAVAYGLSAADKTCQASEHAAWLRARLEHVKKRHRTATVTLGGATQEPLFQHFGSQPAGNADESVAVSFIGKHYAARLQAQYVDNQRDQRYWRADGSYIARRFGNWQLGAGAIDRWWGPGLQSSLALSNNARPVAGVWFSRQTPYAPETAWLQWIGPWNFQVFAGQLEQDREVADAKLIGMRLTFRPAHFLQIGMTRLFQWGGDGRPQGLRSFKDAVIGKDNGQQSSASKSSRATDPSNQVAGFDFRASFPVFGVPSGLYGQAMGEDEAGGMPSKFSGLVGIDAFTRIGSGSQRFFVEATDTVAGRAFGDARYHVAYEHGTYKSGFRYYGRNLATTYEGDARATSLGVQQFFAGGVVLAATVTQASLNAQGGNRAMIADDGAQILQAVDQQDVVITELRLEHGFLGGRLSWSLAATDKAIDTAAGEQDRVTAMAQWRRTFDW